MTEHLRKPLSEMCSEPQQRPEIEGFNKKQEEKLRSKRRLNCSEEDKWKAVYHILFPQDPESDIPSPCKFLYALELIFDDCSRISDCENNTYSPSSQDLVRYEEFGRRNLPRLVQQRLESVVESRTGGVESQLRRELVDIVRDCQEEMFDLFSQQGPPFGQPTTLTGHSIRLETSRTDEYARDPVESTRNIIAESSTRQDSLSDMFCAPPQMVSDTAGFALADLGKDTNGGALFNTAQASDSGFGSQHADPVVTHSRDTQEECSEPSLSHGHGTLQNSAIDLGSSTIDSGFGFWFDENSSSGLSRDLHQEVYTEPDFGDLDDPFVFSNDDFTMDGVDLLTDYDKQNGK